MRVEEIKSGVSGSSSQQKLKPVTRRMIGPYRRREAAKRPASETDEMQSDQEKS